MDGKALNSGYRDETWQVRLDGEGPDAGVGLVFIRDTTPEKSNNCLGGVGTGRDWDPRRWPGAGEAVPQSRRGAVRPLRGRPVGRPEGAVGEQQVRRAGAQEEESAASRG